MTRGRGKTRQYAETELKVWARINFFTLFPYVIVLHKNEEKGRMSVCFLPVRGAGRGCGQTGKEGERVCVCGGGGAEIKISRAES